MAKNQTTIHNKIIVKFIVLEEGEFLYDETTLNLYTCTYPHRLVGHIDPITFEYVRV